MFQVERTIALTQKIILMNGSNDKINYTKLIKLVYFCDREMLRLHGRFITGDTMYSMPMGPVPLKLYNLIVNNTVSKAFENLKFYDKVQYVWNEHLQTTGHDLKIIKDISVSLSDEEQHVTEDVIASFGFFDWNQLVDFCHKYLPEWQDPHGSSILIPEHAIIDAPA